MKTAKKDTYSLIVNGRPLEVYFPAPELPNNDRVEQDANIPYSYETAAMRDTYFFLTDWLSRVLKNDDKRDERLEFLSLLSRASDARELNDGVLMKKGKNTYYYTLLDDARESQREEVYDARAARCVMDNWEDWQAYWKEWQPAEMPYLYQIDAFMRSQHVEEALIFNLNNLRLAIKWQLENKQ